MADISDLPMLHDIDVDYTPSTSSSPESSATRLNPVNTSAAIHFLRPA
jgi:hypothetical protein